MLSRVYAQYRNSPKFIEFLSAIPNIADEMQTAIDKVRLSYDIDGNDGAQLDIIGRVVGVSREFVGLIPLDVSEFGDVDAEFGDVDAEFSALDVAEDQALNDEYYRVVLKAKAARNNSFANYDSIIEAFTSTFPNSAPVTITDNEDMTFLINVGGTLNPIERNILLTKDIIPKPQGVRYLGFTET